MPTYYPINEEAARRAKEMNSFHDYRPGSATEEYRQSVDQASAIASAQKARVDPMYHEKIDRLLDLYARKLAENLNQSYDIAARCPSILIAGPASFPARKKEKQNRSADANMAEWRSIQGILDKIRGTGMGGVSSDDGNAIEKLQQKVAGLEQRQEMMKAVNAFYRNHGTLDGCPSLTPEEIEEREAAMSRSPQASRKPFKTFELTNNRAVIRQTRARIAELEALRNAPALEGWAFPGGEVIMNREENRVQLFFAEKPDEVTMGGASSHDIEDGILDMNDPNFRGQYIHLLLENQRHFRIRGRSWWPEELPSAEEYAEARRNLGAHGWSVDYIITHSPPTSFTGTMDRPRDELTDFLEEIRQKAHYQLWLFGHCHGDRMLDEKHQLVYRQIVQLV